MIAPAWAAVILPRLGVLALLAALGMSCASESITAPSGSNLTLSTPTRSVSVNGTAVLTAELRGNSGQPMAGATITFSSTLGTIEPAEVVTSGSGQATVVFSAGTASGTAVISAGSGSVRASPLSLAVGTAAVGRVALTASPASVPFGGGTSTITAVVTDAAGNPLRSMPVAFSTTAGNATPTNVKTDTNGIVQTTLTTTASAVVTAVAGSTPVETASPAIPTLTGSVTVGVAPRPVPVVSIAASANPVAFSPVTFTIGATPAPGTNTTIQNVTVTFGDGDQTNLGAVSGTAIVVQHVYAAGGTYTVSMTATDSAGGMATASTVLAVGAAAPIAVSVVAGPMVPAGGGPKAIVSFTATVIPANVVIESYLWDFGDGAGVQRTTANQVQHVFANPGVYTVTVTVTEALTERTAVGTVPVSTASGMPMVSIAASANPVAGRATTFTIGAAVAAGSSVTMQSVRVTFGDGTPPVDLGGVIGSGLAAGHVYASPGTYLASVTATDSVRGTATAAIQVVVAAPSAPSVSVTVGANPLAGTPTTFTITAAPAAGSGTTIQNVQVTFGDGTAPVDLGAVNGTTTTQHVYAAGGSYLVSATATDSGGTTATASTQAEVAAPGAPIVSVTASANPIAGTATTFTVATAPAPGSNTTVQNVRVTFGDGTAPVDLGAVSTSTTTQHVYAAGGSYTVSVTATASNGATGTASIQVVVAAPNAPSVSVTASANPVAGTPTTFTITAAPAAGSNTTIQNVQVTFGDGTAPVNLGAVSGSTTTQHVFAASGSYTVSATATASNGATATASTQAVVAAPGAPTISVTAGANPTAGTATIFTIISAPAPGSNTTIQNVRVTFGDGTAPVDLGAVGNSTTTQHVYAAGGSFTVSVTATASNNATATASTQVVVAAAPANSPSVTVTASANPVAGIATTFTITAAPAAGSNTTIQNVRVTYGDGTPPVDLGAVANSTTTQHVYAAAGSFTVTVTATASNNATASTTTQVVVTSPGAPSVSVIASANPVAGRATTFTITAAPAPGSNSTIQTVQVNFGDGTPVVNLGAVSGSLSTQHVFNAAGTYTVSVTATASNGVMAAIAIQVVIAPPPSPTVSITASANPVTGRATTFTITAAPAPGSTAGPNVTVNFGDFQGADVGAVSGTATTQHVYSLAGTYTVSAIATDSGGGTATATTNVVVVPAANVSLAVSANPVAAQAAQFTVTVTPAAGVTIQNVTLRYGDGTQDDLGVIGTSPVGKSHTYATAGTFTASAVVTISGGTGPLNTNLTVVVAPCGPFTHTFSITTRVVDALHNWPGGQQTFESGPTCSVTITAPSGRISDLSGDKWSIQGANGYSISNCTATPQVPSCGGPSSSSDLRDGRPYCSNSALGGGSSTATYVVSCK